MRGWTGELMRHNRSIHRNRAGDKAAIQNNIVPVMAYGETEAQYNEGKTLEVVRKQLTEGLVGIDAKDIAEIVLAYEPI